MVARYCGATHASSLPHHKLRRCAHHANRFSLPTAPPLLSTLSNAPRRRPCSFSGRQRRLKLNSIEPGSTATPQTSELSEVLRLALPALAIVLSDPLQTLVDSACVGRLSPGSSTIQLAALGPNTAIFNATFQVLSFTGIATANLVAVNSLTVPGLTKEERDTRKQRSGAAITSGVTLAAALGVLATWTLRYAGPHWLAAMGTDASVIPFAVQYLAIRALGMPAVMVVAACQGACLGRQDTRTPMYVCVAATLLNLIGDVALIWGYEMGVAGAAMATAAAQWVAAVVFLWWEARRWSAEGLLEHLKTDGFVDQAAFLEFFKVGITLIARTSAGILAYFSMAIAAARLGVVAVAAHQIAMQTFWFYSFFPEPISMAAQSLIAKERGRPEVARNWAHLLVRTGAMTGIVLAGAVAISFAFGGGIFTTDLAVQSAVRDLSSLGMLAMLICGVMMAFDGISLGAGSYGHLPVAVGSGMLATCATLWASARGGFGLQGVWWALCAFYGARLLGHGVFYGFWARKSSIFAGQHDAVAVAGTR